MYRPQDTRNKSAVIPILINCSNFSVCEYGERTFFTSEISTKNQQLESEYCY